MTDWPCHAWLQNKLVWPTNKAALGVCCRLLCTNLLMKFCVLYHQTIMFTGKMVYIRNGQHMLWSQKVYRKSIFQQSGDSSLLTEKTVKKPNLWEKNGCWQKCLDKSLSRCFPLHIFVMTFVLTCKYSLKMSCSMLYFISARFWV